MSNLAPLKYSPEIDNHRIPNLLPFEREAALAMVAPFRGRSAASLAAGAAGADKALYDAKCDANPLKVEGAEFYLIGLRLLQAEATATA